MRITRNTNALFTREGKHKKATRLFVYVFLGALFSMSAVMGAERNPDTSGCSLAEPVAGQARYGDLILRRGRSQRSGLVSFLDPLEYSHMRPVAAFERAGDNCLEAELPARTASASAVSRSLVPDTSDREAWHAAQQQGSGSGGPWFQQSPTFPFDYLLDFDFINDHIGLAVGFEGTILRTEDGGVTWVSRSEGLPTLRVQWEGVSHISADVATVVGTDYGQGGTSIAARTEDGGITWAIQDLGSPEHFPLDVSFADTDSGIAVGYTGMFMPVILRTVNGGSNWEEILPLPGNIFGQIMAVTHVEGATYAGAGWGVDANSGLIYGIMLISTDGGYTWEDQLLETPELSSITFVDAETGFVVGNQGVIMRTDDGGQTWEPLQSGSAAFLGSISCADALECVAVGTADANTQDGRVLRTSDGGDTWMPVTSELWAENYIQTVYHVNANTVLAGVQGAWLQYGLLLRSTDGGENWVHQEFDQIREEFYGRGAFGLSDIASLGSDSAIAVGGVANGSLGSCGDSLNYEDEGGVFRTDDGGVTWRSVTPGPVPSLGGVTFSDPDAGFAFGCEGTVLRTMDGGHTWVPRESTTTRHLRAGHFIDPDVAVLVGGHLDMSSSNWGPVILKTIDGGDTWDSRPVPEEHVIEEDDGAVLTDVFFADADTGFAGGFSWGVIRIIRTVDGGETWFTDEIGSCGEDRCMVSAIEFNTPESGIILAGGTDYNYVYNSRIFRTSDGGENWEDITPDFLGPGTKLADIYFADEVNGVIIGTLDVHEGPLVVLRTNDGGATWLPDEVQIGRGDLNAVALSDNDINRGLIVGAYPANLSPWSSMIWRSTGAPTFPMGLRPRNVNVCEGAQTTVPVAVELASVGDYTGMVDLSAQDLPGGVISDLPSPVDSPAGIQWNLDVGPGVAAGRHIISLTADDGAQQQQAHFHLDVISPDQTPSLIEPVQGVGDVDFRPTLTWRYETRPDAYQVQVATDPGFGDLVIDEQSAFYSYIPSVSLEPAAEHFWRVRAIHDCGEAAWSEVFSFTTADLPAASVTPASLTFQLAGGDSDSDVIDIANTGLGDLVWSIETAMPPAAMDPVPLRSHRLSGTDTSGDQAMTAPATGITTNIASLLGEPLPGLQPVTPAGGVVDCDGEPGIMINDDGTIENGYQGTASLPVGELVLVDRFTPRAYPVSFRALCLAWISSSATEVEFDIVIFADDGENGRPGTELGAMRVSAEGIPVLDQGQPIPPDLEPVWFSYNLTALDVTIESGSAYIGIRKSSDTVFLASDESPDRPAGFSGGYAWNSWSRLWHPIESAFTEYRSLFVRAVEGPPTGCSDPGTVSWLEVNPDGGTTPEGESTPVTVTANATGLAAGEYTANLCISTNDHRPGHSLVVVPVTLVVGGSGPGDLLFRDRFEVGGE